MRSRWGLVAVLLSMTSVSQGHPGRGVVVDGYENVFVSDAVRSVVWKIEPDGTIKAAVRNVHAHWLSTDSEGRVLADDLRYDASNQTYLRGLVRIVPGSAPESVIEQRADPDGLDSGAFCGTPDGVAVARESTNSIETRSVDGSGSSVRMPDSERPVNALSMASDRSLIAIRGRKVLRVKPQGAVEVLAEVPESSDRTPVLGLHGLWGVAITPTGDVLTTDPGTRRVRRIDPLGRVTTVHTSAEPWFATGVSCKDTTIYVLEHGLEGEKNLGPRVTMLVERQSPRVLATVTDDSGT